MSADGTASDPRVIAFHLPQFHPVPENDAWWGKGFTEWTNVVKARPLFDGHHQPQLPADLGFYDLRVAETREHQAALAKAHGIDAFCYYHYWFGGRRVLDRVVDDVLRTGRPDLPFLLCWANENWTRAWDASEQDVLLEQSYGEDERAEHVEYLVRAFADERYLRLDGRPVFLIYRIQALPDALGFVAALRAGCAAAGLADPYLVKVDTYGNEDPPADHGCDAASQFLPHGVGDRITPRTDVPVGPGNTIWGYEDIAAAYEAEPPAAWPRHECVVPGWDNSSRRGDGRSIVVVDNTPERYEAWLRTVRDRAPERGGLVFVNAWNEWAEGAHLEPDERDGMAYLRATARAVLGREPEEVPLPELGEEELVRIGPRFADLYVDLYDRCVRMQRRLTASESQLRRLREESDEARRADLEATTDLVRRLREQIAALEARLAGLEG